MSIEQNSILELSFMENFIIIAILLIVIGFAGFYLFRTRKKGNKCIGCPHSMECSSKDKNGCSNSNQ